MALNTPMGVGVAGVLASRDSEKAVDGFRMGSQYLIRAGHVLHLQAIRRGGQQMGMDFRHDVTADWNAVGLGKGGNLAPRRDTPHPGQIQDHNIQGLSL